MARRRHPKKAIDDAIAYAEEQGWVLTKSSGQAHAWGILRCPHAARDGCDFVVYGTPRPPENHAKRIRKAVDQCPHGSQGDCDE